MQKLIVEVNEKMIDLSKLGFCIKERPSIPTPERVIETIDIPGRDGDLHVEKGYKDIDITVELNFMDDHLKDRIRVVKEILLDCDKIIFSDDQEFCYMVNFTKIGDIENEVDFYGSFEVTFNCKPFSYKLSTFKFVSAIDSFRVDGYKSAPLFKITNSQGDCYFILDNDNSKKIGVNIRASVVYVDCENITCRSDDGINLLEYMVGDFIELDRGIHRITAYGGMSKVEVMTREGWR